MIDKILLQSYNNRRYHASGSAWDLPGHQLGTFWGCLIVIRSSNPNFTITTMITNQLLNMFSEPFFKKNIPNLLLQENLP